MSIYFGNGGVKQISSVKCGIGGEVKNVTGIYAGINNAVVSLWQAASPAVWAVNNYCTFSYNTNTSKWELYFTSATDYGLLYLPLYSQYYIDFSCLAVASKSIGIGISYNGILSEPFSPTTGLTSTLHAIINGGTYNTDFYSDGVYEDSNGSNEVDFYLQRAYEPQNYTEEYWSRFDVSQSSANITTYTGFDTAEHYIVIWGTSGSNYYNQPIAINGLSL